MNIIHDLDLNFEIHYIYQFSDLHIREDLSRKTEYEETFEQLYKYIQSQDTTNSIVVITGDIIHNKLSIEVVEITRNFIINLCKYIRVILIPGNHDIRANDRTNKNKISVLIENTKTNYPYYMLEQGYYQFKNVIFSFTDLYNPTILPIIKNSSKIQIALYHGTIKEVFNMRNTITNSGKFCKTDFKGYKYVLLGDIHQRQIINNNMSYSGSLLQQSKTEQLSKGGYKIDLLEEDPTKSITEINIINKKGFVTILINQEGVITYPPKIPSEARIDVIQMSLQTDKIDEIKNYLSRRRIKPTLFNIINRQKFKIEDTKNDNILLEDIGDRTKLLQIIRDSINDNDKIPDDKAAIIMQTIENHYSKIETTTKKTINIKKLEFNNVAIYGKNNKIDFSKIKDPSIAALTGDNNYGKTTIIDAICINIFGTSIKGQSKDSKQIDFINRKEKIAILEITLNVNTDEWFIKRTYTIKNDNSVKHELTIKVNDKEIPGSVTEKNQYIKNNLCSMETFLLCGVIKQDRSGSLLCSGDIFDNVIHYCGLGNLYAIKEKSSEIIKQNKLFISKAHTNIKKYKILEDKYNIKNFDFDTVDEIIKEQQIKNTLELDTLTKQIMEIETDIIDNKFNYAKLQGQHELIKNYDIDNINNQLESISKDLSDINNQITILIEKQKEPYLCLDSTKTTNSKNNKIHNIIENDNKLKQYLKNCKDINNLNSKIETKQSINTIKQYITNTIRKSKSKTTILTYLDTLVSNNIPNTIETIPDPYNAYISLTKLIHDEQQEIISNIEKEINELQTKKQIKYDTYRDLLNIQSQLLSQKILINEMNKIQQHIINLKKELSIQNIQKDKILKDKKQIDELNSTYETFKKESKPCYESILINELIIKLIDSKNGIIPKFITKIIEQINTNIRDISENLGYDTIELVYEKNKSKNENDDIDTKSKILVQYKKDNSPVFRSGGFFYGMFDLILRVCFSQLHPTIKTSFMIIDEFLDNVSVNNMGSIYNILETLTKAYDWTLIISHNSDILQEISNHLTIIKTDKGYSKITYPYIIRDGHTKQLKEKEQNEEHDKEQEKE